MKSFTTISFTLLAVPQLTAAAPIADSTAATSVSVSYDQKYDVSGTSLSTVACSDGSNGLLTAGYSTFGSLPKFPLIGGAPTIAGWNSENCGACYELAYQTDKIDNTIYILAIDSASAGFNIGLEALNKLTNNQAE
ncbi:Cerato-platanin-domain-containing protein [Penicillium taxi]|uniref:Cerato-platanin-domain-containing protein n=1 Tax=Penicillium taxi TaxID=168475 RepID=UPI002544D93C|nr:Cerato-platanin-domain-containing protein [Penicillium taxi]KAJ5907371.1 Cerato-platanin-domain-containing protein [Penicillium taxi]